MSPFKLHGLLALTVFALGVQSLVAADPTPVLPETGPAAVAKYIGVLKSEASQKEKADACRCLAIIGDKTAIAALAELLRDEKLSHMARYGLETIPDPQVDVTLRRALDELGTNSRQIVGVVGSLGVRRDAKAVPQLVKLLTADNPDVVAAAARSLGCIGTAGASRALMEAWANTPAPKCFGFAEGLLRCADALAAKGMPSEAVGIYDRLRRSTAPHQVRAAGLRGAILARGDEGVALLRSSLHSDDWILFDAALRTAMEIPSKEVTLCLVQECDNQQPDGHKILLIQELGRRGDPAAIFALQRIAKSAAQSQAVRVAALRALPEIGTAEVVEPLVAALTDKDKEVAQAALAGLGGLRGPEADAAVTKMMESGDVAKKLVGFDLAGRRRLASALPTLLKAAEADNGSVRSAAFKRLGELAGVSELPALLDLLARGQDLDAAEQAIEALGARLERPEASADTVIARLEGATPARKAALLRLLGVFGGDKALASVCAAVADSNSEVHSAALRVLCDWKSEAAAAEVFKLAKSTSNDTEKTLCLRSYLAWVRNSDQPADKKLAACREAEALVKTVDGKKLLLGVLGGIQNVAAVTAIAPYLETEATAEEAALAVVTLSDQILKSADAAKVANDLIAPLQKVEKSQPKLAKRAGELIKQAEQKAAK